MLLCDTHPISCVPKKMTCALCLLARSPRGTTTRAATRSFWTWRMTPVLHEILLAAAVLLLCACLLWLGWLTEQNDHYWDDL